MIQFKQLSFWEKVTLFEQIDFLIVGAGIVGSACAFELRKKFPSAKIIILERSYLPLGASTKNAGFACFGSATELLDDLETMDENKVWETVSKRYEGLIKLQERFSKTAIDFNPCGGYDLVESDSLLHLDQLDYLNQKIEKTLSLTNCYSLKKNLQEEYGFQRFKFAYFNQYEGAIDTGKLMLETQKKLSQQDIHVVYGIEVSSYNRHTNEVIVSTNYGEIIASNLVFAVNSFAKQLLPHLPVEPARAQVLVTSEISNLKLNSTFHYDKGYYYFRNIGRRVLLGGARNLDFAAENTFSLEQSALIQHRLEQFLREEILPNSTFDIEYRWSGTMGVGETKSPLIGKISPNCAYAVRLGGMGVALGSLVGEELASLF